MGLFERLGREVGQFTADAKAAAEEHTGADAEGENYRCVDCDARFADRPGACPECESTAVRPLGDGSDDDGGADVHGGEPAGEGTPVGDGTDDGGRPDTDDA